jgi:hypothetical protein
VVTDRELKKKNRSHPNIINGYLNLNGAITYNSAQKSNNSNSNSKTAPEPGSAGGCRLRVRKCPFQNAEGRDGRNS